MVNTLFLPELREMLADDNRAELEEFCVALNAGRTAEFMEGLSDEEVWQVLQFATPDRRAEIFGYFPEPEGAGFRLERFDFLTSNTEREFAGAF